MDFSSFEIALSKPRIGRFLVAANGDKDKAMRLYRLNIQLSQTLFGLLSIFEVTLRNHIDQYYKTSRHDNEWLKNNCGQGGMFSHPSFSKYGFETRTKILTTIAQLGKNYNHDRLVAELSFGFWTYMFAPIQFLVGGQGLHTIYPKRMKGSTQRLIFNQLDEIRNLRNRIAHHEPLCFDRDNQISTGQTTVTYNHIVTHVSWLEYDPKKLFMNLDDTLEIVKMIESEANS